MMKKKKKKKTKKKLGLIIIAMNNICSYGLANESLKDPTCMKIDYDNAIYVSISRYHSSF